MGNWKKKEKEDLKKSKKANIKQVKEEKRFPSFTEYMTANGKVVQDDVPIETVPDYKGPQKAKPEAPGAYPYEAFSKEKKKSVGTPGAYKAPGHAWSLEQTLKPKGEKDEKGFAKEGSKDLLYNPDVKSKPKEAKTKMEQFLAATSDMSTSEYTQFMAERTARGGVEFEAIRYIASNPIMLNTLVREVKRSDCLEMLVESLLAVPDSYEAIIETLSKPENSSYRNKMVRTFDEQLSEMIGPPFHKLDDEDEEVAEKEDDDEEVEDEEFDDESEDEDDEDELSDEEDEFDDEEGLEQEPEIDDNVTTGKRSPVPPEISGKLKRLMSRM